VEVVTPLVAAGVEELSIVLNEARVVRRQVTGADVLMLDPKASILETLAREVVERPLIAILDRVTPEPDEAPLTLLPVQPQGVVCLPDVRTVANGDEALQVERHLLPAHASLQRAAPERVDVHDERQPEIQRVLVDRRDVRFPRRADVLELDEHLPLSVRPQVDVPLKPVQQIAVALVAASTERRR